jgi:hypothetical protein
MRMSRLDNRAAVRVAQQTRRRANEHLARATGAVGALSPVNAMTWHDRMNRASFAL